MPSLQIRQDGENLVRFRVPGGKIECSRGCALLRMQQRIHLTGAVVTDRASVLKERS
ncbi:MAG: hypothetical protein PHC52_02290 [Syntrophales bacterium]|nr:hypothetical protein [Syntrophales bacterium]